MEEIDVILQDHLLDNNDGKLTINPDYKDYSRKRLIAELKDVATFIREGDVALASDYDRVVAYLESQNDEAYEREKAIIYGLCQN